MQLHTKVAVIGGTGKAGKYLVKQLLAHHIPIKLLQHQSVTVHTDNPLIEILEGDARDYDVLLNLLAGCTAVISTVGQPAGEPPVFSDVSAKILKAMDRLGIKRYIGTTGLNVDTPSDSKGPKTKFGTEWMYQNYPKTTADKQVEYELLAASNLDWTLVRLPMIQQTDDLPDVITSLQDCPGDYISASSLGKWMITQLSSDEFLRQAPFVADK
ncbi:NAD(P)-dependent oxidoreductase [Mucilaginibacter psychrotolerans]|uniref:NAD-dependent epimerase/dehydratase family protein n=1 Tax=Mucilaginibacter psychrotolerans TaxID=1524096 RepID=A0A4Y8SAG1_9SPHI|nr:NAD(P)H-binding protein [Mucilaginibacter psychrotolerans]TFF35620.1 NAD-dependent epimerase/dehydratase family protein [Mucilaginibacter psychrotolerans]